jgi:hypothetical protein
LVAWQLAHTATPQKQLPVRESERVAAAKTALQVPTLRNH